MSGYYGDYTIQFQGNLTLDRPLQPQHAAYLDRFLHIRHVAYIVERLQDMPDPLREAVGLPLGLEGSYFVAIDFNEDHQDRELLLSINKPPQGQPDLWCRWRIAPDQLTLTYTDNNNLYLCYIWLQYLIDHFFTPWEYQLNGEIHWQGSDPADHGRIIVQKNVIEILLEHPGEPNKLARPDEPIYCVHKNATETQLVCIHLAGQSPSNNDYYRWFTGQKQHSYLICNECSRSITGGETNIELRQICWHCHKELEGTCCWDGVIGQPEVFERATNFSITQENVSFALPTPILAIQPVNTERDSIWIALIGDGSLVRINFTTQTVAQLGTLPDSSLNLSEAVSLHIAPGGQFAAIVNTHGQFGIVLNLKTRIMTMSLARDNYHIKHSQFPAAFFELNGRLLFVHGTDWNRLDISDPETGACITKRSIKPRKRGEPSPEHDLEYFHCSLTISPNQEWIADNGWFWTPIGIVTTWSLKHWIEENVWESEDGPSRHGLCGRWYYWDGPLCWLDDSTLALWGYGEDEAWLIPAVWLFDATTGKELRWFAGPEGGSLVFDEYLFSFSSQHDLSAWDIVTGERVLQEKSFSPTHYHRGAKQFLVLDNQTGTAILGTFNDR